MFAVIVTLLFLTGSDGVAASTGIIVGTVLAFLTIALVVVLTLSLMVYKRGDFLLPYLLLSFDSIKNKFAMHLYIDYFRSKVKQPWVFAKGRFSGRYVTIT